jgi:hypothetical protein
MAISITQITTNAGKYAGEKKTYSLMVRMYISAIAMESSTEIHQ